jgi:hypothetical protein
MISDCKLCAIETSLGEALRLEREAVSKADAGDLEHAVDVLSDVITRWPQHASALNNRWSAVRGTRASSTHV